MRRPKKANAPGDEAGALSQHNRTETMPANHSAQRSVGEFLARLDRVRESSPGKWRARCPAHGGKSQSLAIRETADGTILLHCFAGCEPAAILSAIGLTINDLFPDRGLANPRRAGGAFPALRRAFEAEDVIEAMQIEILTLQIAASTLARGESLTPEARGRLTLAASRLHAALDAAQTATRRGQ